MTMTVEQLAQAIRPDLEMLCSSEELTSERREALARIVEHLTPPNLLDLLDELERKGKRIAELENLAEAESVGADKAASYGVEWMKRCHAAEKRITELECEVNFKSAYIKELQCEVKFKNACDDDDINLTVEG